MPVARVPMRGLHEVPLERLLFIVVLGCSVLLLSVVMIRSEQAAGVTQAAPRTLFRDGFIVAQQNTVRRTETNDTGMVVMTGEDKKNVVSSEEKASGTGTQVHVEQQGEHTMTKIKTEDGDEITIKRATNSKKITTISAHEDGKITIENRKDDEGDPAKKPVGANLRSAKEEREQPEKERDDTTTRRAGYEKISPGKEKPLLLFDDAELLLAADELEPKRIESEEKQKKKVTVVEVGRSLTKVSLQDAPSPATIAKGDSKA